MKKSKTDKLLKGIFGTSLALSTLSGCGDELTSIQENETSLLPPAEEADCDTWEWDEEEEVYQCVEHDSPRYGHYYSGGNWFPTKSKFSTWKAKVGSSIKSGVTNARSGMGSGGYTGG